jgi:hypothetical protein
MPRPQFTLRALLVAMLVVAAFFGGYALGVRNERQTPRRVTGVDGTYEASDYAIGWQRRARQSREQRRKEEAR